MTPLAVAAAPAPLRITICGHAGVMVECEGARVLLDPVFADRYASDTMAFWPPRRFELDAMPAPTAIVVTHAHLDHFHPPTLERLPKDVPVLLPTDAWLAEQLRALGFRDVRPLADWAAFTQGALTAIATPSEFEWDELGMLFLAGGRSYWHVSDSVVKREIGRKIRADHGPLDLVGARYQPVQVMPGYLRGLGSSYDERDLVVEWLEAACETEPRALFPYAWQVAYVGRHAWANRHLGPWSAEDAARIFARRLPRTRVSNVRPGDVLELRADAVEHHRAASAWVRESPAEVSPEAWEPIDASTLGGVEPAARAPVRASLEALLARELLPFLEAALAAGPNPFHAFREWGVVHQLAVHLGDGDRLVYAIDFRGGAGPLSASIGPHPDANHFTHVSGDALRRVLEGTAGTELFWMSGDVRQYEKILFLGEDGRLHAPPKRGWELYDALPDPLTFFLRRYRGAT